MSTFEYDRGSAGAKAASELAVAVNRFTSDDYRQFAEGLCRHEHRTLQQSVMRALWYAIQNWDEDYLRSSYDMRNEATVTFAAAVIATVKRKDIREPFFPLI